MWGCSSLSRACVARALAAVLCTNGAGRVRGGRKLSSPGVCTAHSRTHTCTYGQRTHSVGPTCTSANPFDPHWHHLDDTVHSTAATTSVLRQPSQDRAGYCCHTAHTVVRGHMDMYMYRKVAHAWSRQRSREVGPRSGDLAVARVQRRPPRAAPPLAEHEPVPAGVAPAQPHLHVARKHRLPAHTAF